MKRGPKPKHDEPATDVVRIRLTPTQRRDLDQVALENHHPSLAAMIREAINTYVGDYRDRPAF